MDLVSFALSFTSPYVARSQREYSSKMGILSNNIHHHTGLFYSLSIDMSITILTIFFYCYDPAMSKIFISHRYTGEDITSLTIALRTITDTLESLGYTVFCSLWLIPYFEEHHMTADDNYAYCLDAMR